MTFEVLKEDLPQEELPLNEEDSENPLLGGLNDAENLGARYLCIVPKEPKRKDWGYAAPKKPKGRTFTASLLGYAECDTLWDAPANDILHPILMVVAASEGALRPFCANLQTGRQAEIVSDPNSHYRSRHGTKLELVKSTKYTINSQSILDSLSGQTIGVRQTFYLPEVFQYQHAMVSEDVKFVTLPSTAWLRSQWEGSREVTQPLRETLTEPLDSLYRWYQETLGYPYPLGLDDLPDFLALATFFCLHLDRRTPAPIIQDVKFYGAVLLAFLQHGLATFPLLDAYRTTWGQSKTIGFKTWGLQSLGFHEGIACRASHDAVQTVLSQVVSQYLSRWS